MNAVRLMLLLMIMVSACNSPKTIKPDATKLYKEYLQIDSLARVNSDSAFFYFDKAANNATDSGYKGTWLQRMATIQQSAGDFFGSNETAFNSLRLFNEKNKKHYRNLSYNYNVLGSNFLDLYRYDDALHNYQLALRYADSSNVVVYTINLGVVHEKKKEYDKAIRLYDSVLKQPLLDTAIYTRVISNLAKARWLRNPGYPAAPEFHEARQLRELKNDKLGLNASYSHLADYYKKTRPDSAFYYALKMYDVAKELGSAVDQAEALEKLVRLSSAADSKNYFDRYDSINDSIQIERSNARNQFADIRFAAQQARADNLVLEKDNSQKRFRIARQLIIIYSTITLFIILNIVGISWYQKRKRLQELQTKTTIRESELRTSQKVHDVVANGLYQVMTEIEHTEMEKEKLLDKIELLYEKSRDISYESSSPSIGGYEDKINDLLSSFSSLTVKVLIVGNNQSFWKMLPMPIKNELEHILLELMINMKKHSAAKNVVVKFEKSKDQYGIKYTDDGIGMGEDVKQGNGLKNTGNRIAAIGGRITFEPGEGKGVRMEISFKE